MSQNITRANRQRVLEFETETQERLNNLGEIETEILRVGQLRSRWLLGVSNIDEVETETFRIKLDYLKAKSELAALDLQVDKVGLEGHYENQTLKFLVSATRPLDSGETKEMRAKALDALARENLDDLCASLRACCDTRAKLAKSMHESTLELSKLRSNNDNRHTSVVAELQNKIGAYSERMKEAVITSKKAHQKITAEYLVLRHNARAAKEVLLRSQNEAAMARKILQERLDKMTEEAVSQRERMEQAAVAELKIMTDDVRNAVIRKEADANDLRRSIQALEKERKQSTRDMRLAIKAANRKYETLASKRVPEVKQVQQELSHLRAMINRVDLELKEDKHAMSPMGDMNYTIFKQMTDLGASHRV